MRTAKQRVVGALWVLLLTGLITACDEENPPVIRMASTTSLDNSGLLDVLLPRFQQESGIAVRVLAVGSGQAIRIAERGDADLIFVHHPEAEHNFLAGGFGTQRYPVMYNHFVLLGPDTDPAGIRDAPSVEAAFLAIARQRSPFISRGDQSGTHMAERALWKSAGHQPRGGWYREVGSGMGATLQMAVAQSAYTLSDPATWLAFKRPGELEILLGRKAGMRNVYSILPVNPGRHPHVKYKYVMRFIDWLSGDAGQQLVRNFRPRGEQAFSLLPAE